MKIKTSELTGAALDWAVATAEGYSEWDGEAFFRHNGVYYACFLSEWKPTTNWSQGGPIIERERMQIAPLPDKGWRGHWRSFNSADRREVWMDCFDERVTALIAAMRCFVSSRLGDTVDVPDELISIVAHPA
jgi:hypothetical protein